MSYILQRGLSTLTNVAGRCEGQGGEKSQSLGTKMDTNGSDVIQRTFWMIVFSHWLVIVCVGGSHWLLHRTVQISQAFRKRPNRAFLLLNEAFSRSFPTAFLLSFALSFSLHLIPPFPISFSSLPSLLSPSLFHFSPSMLRANSCFWFPFCSGPSGGASPFRLCFRGFSTERKGEKQGEIKVTNPPAGLSGLSL